MRRRRKRNKRHGVAAVEFAVAAPLLILIVFNGIEASHYVALRHSAKQISYAAATDIILTNDSDEDIEQRYENLAVASGFTNPTVTISDVPNQLASVVVTIPYNENSGFAKLFNQQDAISESFVYRGEE